MYKRPSIFSFFSGAGFLDLGFESNNFEIVFVNEYHKPFMELYKYSRLNLHIDKPKYGYSEFDINHYLNTKYLNILKEYIEIEKKQNRLIGFIGGPPCPDFSVGGKNKGREGSNGKLSETYIDLICKLEPDFFLFENVKGLIRTNKHKIFYEHLKQKLLSSNYLLKDKIINTLNYGVPQERERIILVGLNKSKFSSIKDLILEKNFKFDNKDIISCNWPDTNRFDANSSVEKPNKIIKELTIEYWFSRNKVEKHFNSKHFFKPKAGLSKMLVIPEGDTSKKSYKRLHRWRFSPTAAYGNNEVHLHPYKARRITVSEALAIQSMPESYIFKDDISLSNMFKAIGNGVPYLASYGIANSIESFIKEKYYGQNNSIKSDIGNKEIAGKTALQLR